MPVYRYQASAKNREDHVESGTVVARNEEDAKAKLLKLRFGSIRLKRLGGLSGIFKRFTADVK